MRTPFPTWLVVGVAATVAFALSASPLLTRTLSLTAEPDKPKTARQETVLLFEPAGTGELTKDQSAKLIAALDRRLNPGGLRSLFMRIKIEAIQGGRIQITVPTADPPEVTRLERMVDSLGSLEFRILATDQRANFKTYIQRAKGLPNDKTQLREEKKGDEPAQLLAWWVPVTEGKESEFRDIHYGTREIADRKGRKQLEVLVVNDPWNVGGEYLARVSPGVDNGGKPCVSFVFNAEGATKFGHLTGYYSPDKVQALSYNLGIILDGKLVTAPRIRSVIFDRGEISGGFTEEKVKDLVDILNAGALPVSLRAVSKRVVSPEQEAAPPPGKPGR